MFDRAERGTFYVKNDNPGPGTYTIPSDRDYREDNVPFKFKVGHVSIWNTTKGPAPNSYTIKYRKHRIKGAAWSKMTEKKPFARYNEENENDGDANVVRSVEESKRLYFWLPELERPKLYKGRPKKNMPEGADAVPKAEAEINLRKYYTWTYEDTMKTCGGCEKYKGPRWSNRKAKRFSDKPSNLNPGPADYDIDGDRPTEEAEWLEAIRFYKRATSKIERYTDKIECEQARNDEPSPADTAFSSDIGKKKSFNVKGTFGNPKKTTNPDQGGPSPMDYSPYHAKCTMQNRKKPPFNVTSSRYDKLPDLPGPADYNPPQGTISFKLCQKLPPCKATYVAPFGTTDIQRPLLIDRGIPDPATYDATVKPRSIPYGVKTSTFTSRRDPMRAKTNTIVSPAYYDTVRAYDKLKRRCDPCRNRKPFNSSGPRLAPPKEDLGIPGPSQYAVNDETIKPGGTGAVNMNSSPDRTWGDFKNDTPGPGQYNIHPLYKDALVRAHCTHNATLVPYSNFYPIKPHYGPPFPKTILKTFVKGASRW
ncbi:hypothetical protein GE061_011970 [Apolygus lucorum]|uniref:Uncharacterized protein n=1 Tax=Apolygus lucorum TaxID=248454 RepID=A0A8S9XT99_APOLU|nr:hypothetical protein GE061_011970 [Apolygus lucorum]